MWVLLIEDEVRLAASLARGLTEEGYTVDVARDGQAGLDKALDNTYDVLVVDWRLPRKDGRAVVQALRDAGRTLPVLMLTALGGVDHRVAGLDAGADDYLTKPFAFEELLARLRALTRRSRMPEASPVLTAGALLLDTVRREVRVADAVLWLRPKEYALLEVFLRHPDHVLSRTVLAERVWGTAYGVTDNVIDVTLSRLRQKLADALGGAGPSGIPSIETVRGVGYRLAVH